jgi:hypothetical protein
MVFLRYCSGAFSRVFEKPIANLAGTAVGTAETMALQMLAGAFYSGI